MTPSFENETLADRIARTGPPSLPEAVALATLLCEGLRASHAKGIAHGALDPSCVILRADGGVSISGLEPGAPRRKSIDLDRSFGHAPHYLAPEQIRGEQSDPRSDVFSVGVILYQLLTGSLPFPGESIHTVAHRVLSEPPVEPAPAERVPSALRLLLLERALQKDAARRPASASGLGEEIRDAARRAGIPVEVDGRARGPEAGPAGSGASPRAGPHAGAAGAGSVGGRHPRRDTPPTAAPPRARGRAFLGGATVLACLAIAGAAAVYLALLSDRSSGRASLPGAGGAEGKSPPPEESGRTIHVLVDPRASLFLDGRPLSSPTFRLAPGDALPHRLRAEADCRSAQADVPAGPDRAEVSLTLAPERVRVPVRTDPPGARVAVNGRRAAGTTPLTIEIDRCADARVEVALAGHTTLEYRLRRGEQVASLAAALASVPLKERKAAKPGAIRVVAAPYASDVFIDGRRAGESGATFTVPAGRHRIALVSDRLFIRVEEEVEAKPGAEVLWRPAWPTLGSLSVRTTPADCSVELRPRRESGFRYLDQTPIVRYRLAAGRYTIRAKRKNTSEVQERDVEVLPGTTVQIAFSFL